MKFALQQIAEALGIDGEFSNLIATGAAIDSRKIKPGDLFIALEGEQVDGHDYLSKAREMGAVAALVSRPCDDAIPQLLVDDVRIAFAHIARTWLNKCEAKVIGITGSNGKTTVKEMVTSILGQVGKVTATLGNYNNDLGVPLTLCRIEQDDDFAVIEMGTNHQGEIAYLVDIAAPDVALINNIGVAHLEGLGSEEGVAREKGHIYKGLKPTGIAIVNADMDFQAIWQDMIATKQQLSFALQAAADVSLQYIEQSHNGSHFMMNIDGVNHYVDLPLPGKHNVANALAAITVALALDVPVTAMVKGLADMKPVTHRLQMRAGINDCQILDDTYNANPNSFQEALNTLTLTLGEKWLVLGDFGELGPDFESVHKQLGEQAKASGVDRLFTIGTNSQLASKQFGEDAEHFDDIETLKQYLEKQLHEGVTCLIKGSRFMKLDQLADQLAREVQ